MERVCSCAIILLSVILTLYGCSGASAPTKKPIVQLEIVPNNSALVKISSSAMAQMVSGSDPKASLVKMLSTQRSMAGKSISAASIPTTITDSNGDVVTVNQAIQVNARYVLLSGLATTADLSTRYNVVLDLENGNLAPLASWPDNPKRIYANATDAFYVSSGNICDLTLATGITVVVSSGAPFWQYTLTGYNNNQTQPWSSYLTWLFVDSNLNLYAVGYQALENGTYNVGQGAKFSRSTGQWQEDTSFDQTFFPNMPYAISNEIPGSLLFNNKWLVIDQNTSNVFEAQINGSTLTVYAYNLDTWSDGSLACSATLSHAMTGTTYLGFDDTIQYSIITDGQSIIMLTSSGSGLNATEIAVPSTIPVTNSITWPGGYVEYWPGGAVTNWNYLNGCLFFFDPSSQAIYDWDLNPSDTPSSTPDGNTSGLTFLY